MLNIILSACMYLLCIIPVLIIVDVVFGPFVQIERLLGFGDHPTPKEINQIQLDLLLEQEDISIKGNRIVCNDCLRESCGFCNNGRIIRQAQELLDKRSEL